MSNPYFQFKQFRIGQDACAMKVSTDACIQGAWAPVPATARRLLDIGAGTGLLSLMLAQRCPQATVDALELDAAAAAQARANVAASPFRGVVRVLPADVRTYHPMTGYDFIICNPPFFRQSLLGPDAARNRARHHLTLAPEDLAGLLERLLRPDGAACFMWPEPEHRAWAALIGQQGWYLQRALSVRDREDRSITRVISVCGRMKTIAPQQESLLIREADGRYSPAFTALLAPFYLQL